MLNKLGITFAFLFLLMGAFLLYDPDSGPRTSGTAQLLGGATFVSLGLITILLIAKDWLDWRRHYKQAANGVELEPGKSNLTPK